MIRRTALTLALCASGCTPQETAPEESPVEAAQQVEQVAESLAEPERYYTVNVAGTAAVAAGANSRQQAKTAIRARMPA